MAMDNKSDREGYDQGPLSATTAENNESDRTGRKRFLRNLLSGWAVELVVVISGFVTPRLIDANLGQVQLGIWDLGWSVVSYFRLLGFGLAGGLNRFVALNYAKGDHIRLDRFVSSTIALQLVVASVTLMGVFAGAYFAELLVKGDLAPFISPIRWVIVLLGATLSVRMLASPARGVLTGHHLWSVNSAVSIAGDITALLALIAVLMADGGLRELAAAYLAVTIVTETLRYIMARQCYGRRLYEPSAVRMAEIRELLVFGMKSNIGELPRVIVGQTLNIVLVVGSGAAALAVLARALALQRHIQVLIRSFTVLLTSTVGSMKGLGRESEFRSFFIDSMRVSYALTIPLYLLLATLGDLLILLWMGRDYVHPGLLQIVCLGAIFPAANSAAFRILVGLNEHGRAAIAAFLGSMTILGGCFVIVDGTGWTIKAVAISLGLSLTVGSALPITILACRRFSISFFDYLSKILVRPLLANLPFSIALIGGGWVINPDSILQNFSVLILAGGILIMSYWILILTVSQKQTVMRKVSQIF